MDFFRICQMLFFLPFIETSKTLCINNTYIELSFIDTLFVQSFSHSSFKLNYQFRVRTENSSNKLMLEVVFFVLLCICGFTDVKWNTKVAKKIFVFACICGYLNCCTAGLLETFYEVFLHWMFVSCIFFSSKIST